MFICIILHSASPLSLSFGGTLCQVMRCGRIVLVVTSRVAPLPFRTITKLKRLALRKRTSRLNKMVQCQLDNLCEGSDCICNVINNIVKLGNATQEGGDPSTSSSNTTDDDLQVDCCAGEGFGVQIIIIDEDYDKKIC